MLDQAFDALKSYDWGKDVNQLSPIEQAIVATRDNAQARGELENRLAGVLKSEASRDAKDYACRKLMLIGTATSVPTLAELLTHKDLAHMARYALERMQAPEAAGALRGALEKVGGALKIGVISSLGGRRDNESVEALAKSLDDSDVAIARAAALALGAIRSKEAAQALADAKPKSDQAKQAVADARLACAEALLADGNKTQAIAIYKTLAGTDQPKHVRLAATRGMLAGAGK